MLKDSTLKFLSGLKKNNRKDWFDAHRAQYEDARKDFSGFIQDIIETHGKKDKGILGLEAGKCLFRINRDIRFSKNKSPYKTNFGASISEGGKKSGLAGYYIHCEPGESFVGGGIWMPEPSAIKKIRQEIDYNWKEFSKIIRSSKFKNVYGDLYMESDVSLQKVPSGYEKDNPAASYLKLKSWIAMKSLPEKTMLSPKYRKETLEAFAALQPLVEFLNHAVRE